MSTNPLPAETWTTESGQTRAAATCFVDGKVATLAAGVVTLFDETVTVATLPLRAGCGLNGTAGSPASAAGGEVLVGYANCGGALPSTLASHGVKIDSTPSVSKPRRRRDP